MTILSQSRYVAVDYEDITLNADAVFTLSAAKISPGGGQPDREAASIYFDVGSVRVRMDGGTPSASSGDLYPASTRLIMLEKENLKNLKFFRASASSSPVLRVHYYERRVQR